MRKGPRWRDPAFPGILSYTISDPLISISADGPVRAPLLTVEQLPSSRISMRVIHDG